MFQDSIIPVIGDKFQDSIIPVIGDQFQDSTVLVIGDKFQDSSIPVIGDVQVPYLLCLRLGWGFHIFATFMAGVGISNICYVYDWGGDFLYLLRLRLGGGFPIYFLYDFPI